jgi:hypothetical protein
MCSYFTLVRNKTLGSAVTSGLLPELSLYPLPTEQGIILAEQGILAQEQGISSATSERIGTVQLGENFPASPAAINAPRMMPKSMTEVTSAKMFCCSDCARAGACQYPHEATSTPVTAKFLSRALKFPQLSRRLSFPRFLAIVFSHVPG